MVEAELTGEGRFEHARALRIVERGRARVDAPCPIVHRCGGCPLQQVSYQAQLAAKQELTADALERIGGFTRGSYELAAIVPSPKQFHYRRRARMHRAGSKWGFAGPEGAAEVDACLLFEPRLQELADAVRAIDLPGATDLGLLVGESKGAVDLRGGVRRAEKLLSLPLVKGVTFEEPGHACSSSRASAAPGHAGVALRAPTRRPRSHSRPSRSTSRQETRQEKARLDCSPMVPALGSGPSTAWSGRCPSGAPPRRRLSARPPPGPSRRLGHSAPSLPRSGRSRSRPRPRSRPSRPTRTRSWRPARPRTRRRTRRRPSRRARPPTARR